MDLSGQFEKGLLKSIDGNKPPPCPLADKQDDYCGGWKGGWEETVVKELDFLPSQRYVSCL